MASALDIITDAMAEMGAAAAGETIEAADAQLGLRKLNRILDSSNAQKLRNYASSIVTYDLVASTQSRTIGATGNYVVTPRPVEIIEANLVNGSTRTPIDVRDSAWWMSLTDRTATGQPSALFYNPTFPNGTLYFHPIPDSSSYDVELQTRTILVGLAALGTTFTFPPGYEQALVLTLAESLCAPFARPVDGKLADDARKARAAIESLNSRAPRINLGHGGRSFNIRSGG